MKAFWEWVLKEFQPEFQNEIEAYLAQSVDYKDLEDRMKRLMYRGMPI